MDPRWNRAAVRMNIALKIPVPRRPVHTREFGSQIANVLRSLQNDAHDYKYSSAVLEDYHFLAPELAHRYLAASVFNLKGSAAPDNELVARTRQALKS